MNEFSQESKPLDEKKLILSRIKRRVLKHVWLVRTGLLASFVLAFYLLFGLLGLAVRKTHAGDYFTLIKNFVFTPQAGVKAFDRHTNVLILGKGGEGHEAPDLTDTIIFTSISHNTPSITQISLPRDIWVPSIRAKLNSAYYWGNQKEPGGGIVLAKSLVEEIVGQQVHYAVVIDFSGFKKIIDVLGGVEVEVEKEFVDERYPIAGRENDTCEEDPEFRCRYETLRFTQGKQLMDGERALKFVRSRNAEGEEGTDLAREGRQQKVLSAIKEKVLSREVLLSPRKMKSLWAAVKDSTETDVDSQAAAVLARRALQSKNNINFHILSEEFLVNPQISPRFDNQYVFLPRDENWDTVHQWTHKLLDL